MVQLWKNDVVQLIYGGNSGYGGNPRSLPLYVIVYIVHV